MANYSNVAAGTGDAQVVTGKGRLLGFSARESAGTPAAASFILRDGTSASGTPIVFVNLAASETLNGDYGGINGIEFANGLYLDRVSGTTDLSVYL